MLPTGPYHALDDGRCTPEQAAATCWTIATFKLMRLSRRQTTDVRRQEWHSCQGEAAAVENVHVRRQRSAQGTALLKGVRLVPGRLVCCAGFRAGCSRHHSGTGTGTPWQDPMDCSKPPACRHIDRNDCREMTAMAPPSVARCQIATAAMVKNTVSMSNTAAPQS